MAKFCPLPFNNVNTQKIQILCPESTMAVCKKLQVFNAVKRTKPDICFAGVLLHSKVVKH